MSLVIRFGCKRLLFALLRLFGLVLEDSGCFVLFLFTGFGNWARLLGSYHGILVLRAWLLLGLVSGNA